LGEAFTRPSSNQRARSRSVQPSRRPRIKVCCIASVEEAWTAIEAGAAALGLVSWMPSGPGVIEEARIAEIAARVPPGVATFLLTCARDADTIAAQQRRTGVSTVQLVDALPAEELTRLRGLLPGIGLVQVIHVRGEPSLAEAMAAAPRVDALLLDSGDPTLAVKELGGTGRVHDWEISRRIREASPVPVYLAGGLRPDNAGDAVQRVGPFGLDVCSGVRTDGRLDPDKLSRLIAAAHAD
jgi:phosphoribosylanthranilate isomerase